MNLFWTIKANGTVLGPWSTIGPAVDAATNGGDSVVSTTAIDWTAQLAERRVHG